MVNYDNIEQPKINVPSQPVAQVDKFEKLERNINEEHLRQKTWFDINTGKTERSVSNLEASAIKMANLADSFDDRIKQLSKECNKVREDMLIETADIKKESLALGSRLNQLEQLHDKNVIGYDKAILNLNGKVAFIENFLSTEFDGKPKKLPTSGQVRSSIFSVTP